MADLHMVATEGFVWRSGGAEVEMRLDGDSWSVICRSAGKLLGPAAVVYEARHRRPLLAAWDVMSRVARVSSDEEEGVRAGQQAARWLRSQGWTDRLD